MAEDTLKESKLVAQLNDLLQLDYDSIAAYEVAIKALQSPSYQGTVRRFRADHERHITELTQLIRERGGIPIELPHLPTGLFKLAVQQAGALGGDKAVLLAFKANERQARDKYRRAAEASEDLVAADILARAAEDEAKHYAWALETLEDPGAGADTITGQVERVVEITHARMGDAVEAVERGAMTAAVATRRAVKGKERPLLTAAVVAGIGFVAAQVFRGRR
ncbi:MAG TPA: ferritin-like domain-containing protein [Gemmatimonadaceae bacterium]|nr:ferritin-like domain-containing protein [Gemmatimonadaceae bacterium]